MFNTFGLCYLMKQGRMYAIHSHLSIIYSMCIDHKCSICQPLLAFEFSLSSSFSKLASHVCQILVNVQGV